MLLLPSNITKKPTVTDPGNAAPPKQYFEKSNCHWPKQCCLSQAILQKCQLSLTQAMLSLPEFCYMDVNYHWHWLCCYSPVLFQRRHWSLNPSTLPLRGMTYKLQTRCLPLIGISCQLGCELNSKIARTSPVTDPGNVFTPCQYSIDVSCYCHRRCAHNFL